ncbi:hypothetical protein DHD08_12035 [Arenibacter sp. H213]|nr:hypothetical protein [Arenibacter sp. H213]
MYPLIENAYQLEREHQKKRLQTLLILASILSVLLILTIIFIIRQFYKLSEARKLTLVANEKLQNNNIALAEANSIKEEYIGRFLNLCSIYIEKMGKHHRILNKKAKEGNLTELYRLLKSNQFIGIHPTKHILQIIILFFNRPISESSKLATVISCSSVDTDLGYFYD